MKESRKQLLQMIYDYDQTKGGPLQIMADGSDTGFDSLTLRNDVSYLKNHGYVDEPIPIAMSYVLQLTVKGEQFVENGFPSAVQASTASFNFSGATFTNSTVGKEVSNVSNVINNEVSGNTFTYNAGASLAELESLIQAKPSEDQAVLNEMLEVLREIQSSEKPVDKGRLARFYEVVKKSSDLLLPLGKFFVDIFFRI